MTAPALTRWRATGIGSLALASVLTAMPVTDASAREPARRPPDTRSGTTPPAPFIREYLHRQEAGTSLVFRFESFEAELVSRLSEAGNAPFKASGVPGLRLGPVFQFVEAVATARELVIEVELGQRSGRARVDMQVIRFDPSGPDQDLEQQAYRLLSHGLETAPPGRVDLWQSKVISLRQAVTVFDRLGMQEPMLWAEFYASHFMLERLGDALSAVEGARIVQAAAERSRQQHLLLAAQQLEGRALLALASHAGSIASFDRARRVFQHASARAAELDFQHERALALFHIGLAYEREARHEAAFQTYQEALAVTDLAEDTDFANAVRRHAADLHERLGDTDSAIALMQQIESPAPAPATPAAAPTQNEGATDPRSQRDRLRYLYEQGRLLHKAYRHGEAVDVLFRARGIASAIGDDSAMGPVGLLLGQALYQSGRFEEAAELIVDAIPRTSASAHAPALAQAWGTLADIRRQRGEHEAAAATREQQARFITSAGERARLDYQRGLDEFVRAGTLTTKARQNFHKAASLATQAGLTGVAYLSRLHLCLGGTECPASLSPPVAGWLGSAPAEVFEARWLGIRIRQARGEHGLARAGIEALLTDILLYRAALPGVLGSWYRQRRDVVYDTFVEQEIRNGTRSQAAVRTLAALDAIRMPADAAESRSEDTATAGNTDTDRLRSLLAAREAAADSSGPVAEITELLQRVRLQVASTDLAAQAARLQTRFENLPAGTVALAFYITGHGAHAWIGSRYRIELQALSWNADRTAALARASAALREFGQSGDTAALREIFENIGAWLLRPIEDRLAPTIAFLPLGSLQGVPLDGLWLDGRPLAARHQVINLMSLAAFEPSDPEWEPPARVYIAGNRQTGSGDFSVATPPSAELRTVANRFVGPGLTLRQGAALQWDEFHDPRFTRATLLHLAMPAVENLADITGAHLLMSDNATNPERLFLWADDLPAPLQAHLAVLSNATFTGLSPSPLGERGGLIDSFLRAGTGAVLASLWPVGDAAAAKFMDRFYQQLDETANPAAALQETKRIYLSEGPAALPLWAAFQLYRASLTD